MKELINRIRTQLTELWNRTERKDRVRFFTLVGVALVVIIVAVSLLTRTQYAVLYHNLDPAEAGEILATLEGMGVKTQIQGTDTILVPQDEVNTLYMQMASSGVGKKGLTHENFALGSGFGTTDYEKRMYELFDKEDNLAATLMTNPGVSYAVVQIARPDANATYLKNATPVTASVMLTLDGPLSQENISAIEALVAASVSELTSEHVFITDQNFNRLNRREGLDLSSVSNNRQMTEAVRDDIVSNVMALLVPIYGTDNVRVSGNVMLDFDEHSTESVVFAPVVDDEGIAISVQEIVEKATGTPVSSGVPGTDTNGAGTDTTIYPEVNYSTMSNYSKVTKEVNYEVNQTIDKIQHEQGKIQDLSISVAINVDNLSSENNASDAVKNLVACAVGLDKTEYDRIAVEFRKFDGVAVQNELMNKYQDQRRQNELFDLIKNVLLYAVIVICVLLILRRISKFFAKKPSDEAKLALDKLDDANLEADEYARLVQMATAPEGAEITITKSTARQRVEEFADKDPESVANLVRNWLNEDNKRKR